MISLTGAESESIFPADLSPIFCLDGNDGIRSSAISWGLTIPRSRLFSSTTGALDILFVLEIAINLAVVVSGDIHIGLGVIKSLTILSLNSSAATLITSISLYTPMIFPSSSIGTVFIFADNNALAISSLELSLWTVGTF